MQKIPSLRQKKNNNNISLEYTSFLVNNLSKYYITTSLYDYNA
jgi:hypothetical protein